MLSRLQDYANGKNVILLKDVTARLLTEWRSGWTFKKGSDSPAVHWSVVKTFFKWAFSTDLIPADPSAKLKSLPSGRHQVLPLSRDEFDRILAAVDQCGFTPAVEYRVKQASSADADFVAARPSDVSQNQSDVLGSSLPHSLFLSSARIRRNRSANYRSCVGGSFHHGRRIPPEQQA
jgi:hypothetical protein